MIILSGIILVVTAAAMIFSLKMSKQVKVKTAYIAICGVFLSIWAAMIFVCEKWSYHNGGEGVLIALLHSIQVMLAGFEFKNLYEFLNVDRKIYIYFAFLFTLAPICTFGFVMLFFEKFTSGIKYVFRRNCDVYILSQTNEKTIALANSVRKKDKKAIILFCGEKKEELCEDVKKVGGMFSSKSFKDISLMTRSKKSRVFFFAMSENEAENIENTLALIKKFSNRNFTEIYTMSTSDAGGILLDSAEFGKVKVRRINTFRQLAYSQIDNTTPQNSLICGSVDKKISVLIMGLGGYGTEFLKAVLWCGQIPGYKLEINVIDKDANAKSRFYEKCPEIIEKNGNDSAGEACYNLNFFCDIDVNCHEFYDVLEKTGDITLAFICLGDDEQNIDRAIKLRTFTERKGVKPVIKTVVQSSEKSGLLLKNNLLNYKNQSYNISFIGCVDEIFSVNNIMSPQLEKWAEKHHLSYVKACAQNEAEKSGKSFEEVFEKIKNEELDKFNNYEYFRNSSAATAIYRTYFKNDTYSDEEGEQICIYEHMRWNAYMRCEGYVSGEVRNDIAKTHPDLVPFDKLSRACIEKDLKMVETK